jgi:predicted secreted protein
MLPVIGLVAVTIYIVVWRSGLLDELSQASRSRQERKKSRRRTVAPSDPRRLNVFEEFIERLSDTEDPQEPKDPEP